MPIGIDVMLNTLQIACAEVISTCTTLATLQLICWWPDGGAPQSGFCAGSGGCTEDAGCITAGHADVHSASQCLVDPGEGGLLRLGRSPRVASAAGEICDASVADETTRPKVK